MQRKYSIDILRIISALAVVVIHAISGPVSNYSGTLDSNLSATLNCIHSLMKWSVPVFFMITGYCIVGKSEYTYKNCSKHVLKYIAVLATVGLAYALLEEISIKKAVNISVILRSVQNVISGNMWDHMWYVYAIIGIYLTLPVLHPFMQSHKKNRLILAGLLFLFTIILPTVEQWFPIGVDFPFGSYLFYICFGCIVAKQDLGKKTNFCIVFAGILCLLWILFNPQSSSFSYRHPSICMVAGSIFVLISSLEIKPSKYLLFFSQCTWGVYLIHPLFINLAVKFFKIDLLSHMPYLQLIIFWITLCLLSFFTTYALRKIPMIKKLF